MPEPTLAAGEERKVITVLFADLVGFTSHTEAHDPEDVKRRLTAYHRRMREHVERYGGHVEKLMGDGVFAVFGVPAAHEDDPERAVRAALRFQSEQTVDDGDLSVRIAITTGEAIVQLDRSDRDREGIIGDVVNTASRLEAHAPPGGVLVDERTYLATSQLFEYRAAPAVDVRGKEGVLAVWLAEAATSRFGIDVEAAASTPFVGRDHELALVERSFERAIADRSLQLVTISGEPGSGKSRLVDEFLTVVDDRPELVWWRQGRCLPYGDGVAFWALGEIVKAQAGILDSDDPVQARAKLVDAVTALAPAQADWVTTCLVPLAGVGPTPPGVEREELFRGWLRFIEALAAKRPLVMVIEDLHWADEAFVEFLGFLIRRSVDSPILLLATARPELFSAHPDWGAGLRNASSAALAPLADTDAAALLGALVPGRLMTAEAQEALLERCGGNPLHLVEFVRLATERGMLDRLAEMPVPDSVHAIVAARLDLLDAGPKAVLQTAAVVGKVFWDGPLVFTLPVHRSDVRDALDMMAARDLVRPVRQSSMAGEEEWAFTHSVIRDVAYGQVPKSERRARHEAVARWMEAVAGERSIDIAEVLAHHYDAALEGQEDPPAELAERAYVALMAASLRAESLDARRSAGYAERAALIARTDRDRGRAWLALADLRIDSETTRRAATAAVDAFSSAGLPERQSEALGILSSVAWFEGQGSESRRLAGQAVALVEDLPDSPAKGKVLMAHARALGINGDIDESRKWFEIGRPSVDAFGDAALRVDALNTEGALLSYEEDPRGIEILERARRLASDRGMTGKIITIVNNLETTRSFLSGSVRAVEGITAAIEMALERGFVSGGTFSRLSRMEFAFPIGLWDLVLEDAAAVLVEAAEHGGEQVAAGARVWQAYVAFHRSGDVDVATAGVGLDGALEIGDPQTVGPSAAVLVAMGAAAGRLDEARRGADALGAMDPSGTRDRAVLWAAPWMGSIDRLDVLERLVAENPAPGWRYPEAAVAFGRGVLAQARGEDAEAVRHFEAAVMALDELGHRWDATVARIHVAEALDAVGRADDAAAARSTAREVAAELGAQRALGWLDRGSPQAAAG